MRTRHQALSVMLLGSAVLAATTGNAAALNHSATAPTPVAAPVVVIDAGDPAQLYDLTPAATVGLSATTTYEEHILGSISGGGITDQLDERSSAMSVATVLEVAADGSYSGTQTFTQLSTMPDGISGFIELELLVNVPMAYTIGPDGSPLAGPTATGAVTPEQEAAIGEFASSGVDLERFPIDPVGVGAVWTVDQTSGMDGVDGNVAYTYRFAGVEGDTFRVEVDYTLDFANLVDTSGLDVSGAGVGTSVITGSLTAPVALRVEEHVAFDMVISDSSVSGHAVYGVWRTTTSTIDTPA